jgi:potassium-transporting ATPase KdpC subunit
MRRQLIAGLRVLVVLSILLGIVYPLGITAVARLTMRGKAEGSLVSADGRIVGSALLGQAFLGAGWFHPRPGAYDPTASGPSNLGPNNGTLVREVRARAAAVDISDGLVPGARLPADAVMGSGSGLDPDISPAYALLQVPRVARARGLDEAAVRALVEEHVTGRTLGFLGEPRVNVLALNLALEGLASGP